MNWFEKLVGFSEGPHGSDPDHVREKLELNDGILCSKVNDRAYQAGVLDVPNLNSLRAETVELLNQGIPTTVVERVGDVQAFHVEADSSGAFFQVASQFNLLEMVGPSVTPEQGVGRYEGDHTQGPACAIACGAGTILRNYFAVVDGEIGQTATRQIDCSRDLGEALENESGERWEMQNGYLLPSEQGLKAVRAVLESSSMAALDSLAGKLRIGVQRDTEVTIDGGGHFVTQAFCSAVPVAYSNLPASLWEPLACLILDASYEATLHAALLNSIRTGNSRVYLTLLGGGAFGNRPEWIVKAIEKALHRFRGAGLDIFIVSYGCSSPVVASITERFNHSQAAS